MKIVLQLYTSSLVYQFFVWIKDNRWNLLKITIVSAYWWFISAIFGYIPILVLLSNHLLVKYFCYDEAGRLVLFFVSVKRKATTTARRNVLFLVFFFCIRQYSILCYSPTFSLSLFFFSLVFFLDHSGKQFCFYAKSNNIPFPDTHTHKHTMKSVDCHINYCLLYSKSNRTIVELHPLIILFTSMREKKSQFRF
jgi:hypothetical protein